jgi:hypothetical protein
MGEQRQQTGDAGNAEVRDAPAGAAPGDAGRAAWEWWWAGRLMALHHVPVEACPYRRAGEPRQRWLAGFASGTRTVAGHFAWSA